MSTAVPELLSANPQAAPIDVSIPRHVSPVIDTSSADSILFSIAQKDIIEIEIYNIYLEEFEVIGRVGLFAVPKREFVAVLQLTMHC